MKTIHQSSTMQDFSEAIEQIETEVPELKKAIEDIRFAIKHLPDSPIVMNDLRTQFKSFCDGLGIIL